MLKKIYAWSQTEFGDIVISSVLFIAAGAMAYGALWLNYFLGN